MNSQYESLMLKFFSEDMISDSKNNTILNKYIKIALLKLYFIYFIEDNESEKILDNICYLSKEINIKERRIFLYLTRNLNLIIRKSTFFDMLKIKYLNSIKELSYYEGSIKKEDIWFLYPEDEILYYYVIFWMISGKFVNFDAYIQVCPLTYKFKDQEINENSINTTISLFFNVKNTEKSELTELSVKSNGGKNIFKIIKNKPLTKKREKYGKINYKIDFRFFKRENIDKKLMRNFRKTMRTINKNNYSTNFEENFLKGCFTPPFSKTINDKLICFRTCNTTYLRWLFSHGEIFNIWNTFIDIKFDKMIPYLSTCYKVTDEEEIEKLRIYLRNFTSCYM